MWASASIIGWAEACEASRLGLYRTIELLSNKKAANPIDKERRLNFYFETSTMNMVELSEIFGEFICNCRWQISSNNYVPIWFSKTLATRNTIEIIMMLLSGSQIRDTNKGKEATAFASAAGRVICLCQIEKNTPNLSVSVRKSVASG